jgi:hypothetical protein
VPFSNCAGGIQGIASVDSKVRRRCSGSSRRSENLRVGLVRDHLGPRPRRGEPAGTPDKPFRDPREETRALGYPLTNPRNFLTMWRPQIQRLFDELSVNATIPKIQGVRCAFNPFFELLLDRTKPVSAWAH